LGLSDSESAFWYAKKKRAENERQKKVPMFGKTVSYVNADGVINSEGWKKWMK